MSWVSFHPCGVPVKTTVAICLSLCLPAHMKQLENIFVSFTKICQHISIFVTIRKREGTFHENLHVFLYTKLSEWGRFSIPLLPWLPCLTWLKVKLWEIFSKFYVVHTFSATGVKRMADLPHDLGPETIHGDVSKDTQHLLR
jgi:hypothetical protein